MASNKVGGPSEQLETVRKPVNRGRIETGKQIQRHKYTNTQIHKYTYTQIYKYTNIQIHKYTNK